jgi:hypothetical protein
MAAENIGTTVDKDIGKGEFLAIGPKIGMIQTEIDFDDVTYSETGDWVSVFTFTAPALVLAAGMQVVTAPTDTTSAVALGVAGSDVLMAAVTMSAADVVGASSFGETPLYFAADAVLTAAISTASSAGAHVRFWAIIADVGDMAG